MALEYSLQLYDSVSGKSLSCNGKFKVVQTDTATPVTITDVLDAAITQPGTINNGAIQFRVTDNSIVGCDVYILTDTGYAKVEKITSANAQPREVWINTDNLYQTIQIPMKVVTDGAAATELDTGFDLVTDSHVLPFGAGIRVITLDATEDLDLGILSSESGGDANGFLANISTAAATTVFAAVTVTTGVIQASPTRGALIAAHTDGTNSDDRGLHQHKTYRCDGTAKSISCTFSTGSDTAAVVLIIPTILPKPVRA